MLFFCALHEKLVSTLHDFSHMIYFYCWKKLKKHVFSPKIGLTISAVDKTELDFGSNSIYSHSR